jgi:hopanoid biosynthesis associated RND transporter like protein HpnN
MFNNQEGAMTAQRKPLVETPILARMLYWIVRLAIRFPWLTIVLGMAAVGGSIYWSGTRLSYRASRAALLDERDDYHRRWLKYCQEFGDKEDVVVVVQGAGRDAIVPVLDEVVRELDREPRFFQAILHEIDLTKLRDKGLHYLAAGELRTIEGFLDDVEPIVRGNWAWLSPGTMATGMCARLQDVKPDQLQQAMAAAQVKLAQMAESLLTALSKPGTYKSPWPEMSGSAAPLAGLTSHRLLTDSGRMGFVLMKLAQEDNQGFVQNAKSIQLLRSILDGIKVRHVNVKVGVTGLPIMEYDEMQRSQSSMTIATILSFLGVFLVLVAGFGGIRHSLLAMAALLLGLTWSLGYTTLVVGHLNILSSAFGAVLIGLGINYGIYFIARYLQLRKTHHSVEESLLGTATSVGPGIAVSALSSAIAFFMAGITEFTGVAELGLIAGGGIVLCLTAAFTVLPALIRLADAKRADQQLPLPLDFHLWLRPLVGRPRLMLTAAIAVTAVLGMGVTRLSYDYNLMHLEPANLESVELEQKLVTETKDSAYFALSMARTPEEVAARKARFLQLPTVERVDEIATRFPSDTAEKRPIIERIRQRLAGLPDKPQIIPLTTPEKLGQMLSAIEPLMAANLQMANFQRQLQEVRSLLGQLPPNEYYARLSEYQQRVAGDLLGRLQQLRSVANPEPPSLADLPDGLVTRFVGHSGVHLLRIYVKGDIWDIKNMEQFVTQVRSVDAEVTGNPLQIYEASLQMRRSYEQAALYALCMIVPVVFLNFGSLGATLLAVCPLALGMLQMLGLMGILDIPLNSANMIGLSLMLGMGMENGVLITQDYLGQRGRYRMGASTSVAVVLNTITTMVGFAVLIIADHRGLQSLGRVLTIGMSCCWFSSLIILPTLLVWLTRNRQPDEHLVKPSPQPVGDPSAAAVLSASPHRRFDTVHPLAAPVAIVPRRVTYQRVRIPDE